MSHSRLHNRPIRPSTHLSNLHRSNLCKLSRLNLYKQQHNRLPKYKQRNLLRLWHKPKRLKQRFNCLKSCNNGPMTAVTPGDACPMVAPCGGTEPIGKSMHEPIDSCILTDSSNP